MLRWFWLPGQLDVEDLRHGQTVVVAGKGRSRWMSGVNEVVQPRLRLQLVMLVTCGAAMLGGAAIGYFGSGGGDSFRDSVPAGIGLLVGLAIWFAGLAWFVAVGGSAEARRRLGRRRTQLPVRTTPTSIGSASGTSSGTDSSGNPADPGG